MNVESTLRLHLADPSLLGTGARSVGADDNLFDLIDSLQMLRLVANLEKVFRIEIYDFELLPVNLHSVKALTDLVRSKARCA